MSNFINKPFINVTLPLQGWTTTSTGDFTGVDVYRTTSPLVGEGGGEGEETGSDRDLFLSDSGAAVLLRGAERLAPLAEFHVVHLPEQSGGRPLLFTRLVEGRRPSFDIAHDSEKTATTLQPSTKEEYYLRPSREIILRLDQDKQSDDQDSNVLTVRIIAEGRHHGSVRFRRARDINSITHLILERVDVDLDLEMEPADFINEVMRIGSEIAASRGYLFDLVSGGDTLFSNIGKYRDIYNHRFKDLPDYRRPLSINNRSDTPLKLLPVDHNQRFQNVLMGVVGPHVPPEELKAYEEAVGAFHSGQVLSPEQRAALQKLLGVPGWRSALGFCGSCMLTQLTGVSPFAWGAGVMTTELTAIPPIDAPKEGLLRYFRVSPELRTHFTNIMLQLEQVLGERIQMLSPGDIGPEMRRYLETPDIRNLVESSYADLYELALEHDSLTTLLYNASKNMLFGGEEPITFYRAHINMTTLNERDAADFHGDLYLDVVRSWFQEKFGRIYSVRNPERTTFEFISVSPRQVRSTLANFNLQVRHRLTTAAGADPKLIGMFEPRVIVSSRTLSMDNFYQYAVRTDEDLDAFRDIIEFDGRFSVGEMRWDRAELARFYGTRPDFDAVLKRGTPRLRRILEAMVFKAMLELNAELAAQTTYFEKEIGYGKALYTEEELPRMGDAGYERWREKYLAPHIGFVGPGRYDPAYHNADFAGSSITSGSFLDVGGEKSRRVFISDQTVHPMVERLIKAFPPIKRITGQLSRRWTERGETDAGGLIELFLKKQQDLVSAKTEDVPMILAEWKQIALDLLGGFRNFYILAVTEPRNGWVMKGHDVFYLPRGSNFVPVGANFFVQEAALNGNRFLVTFEYDSFRAFTEKNTGAKIAEGVAHYVDDEFFHRVNDAFYKVAHQMNLRVGVDRVRMGLPIIVASGGDHKTVSLTFKDVDEEGMPVDAGGRPVDPVEYLTAVQRMISEDIFGHLPYQDLAKVVMREFEITGGGIALLKDSAAREMLRQAMNLNAQPQLAAETESSITLAFPLRDMSGADVSQSSIREHLQTVLSSPLSVRGEVGGETLPIDIRTGGTEIYRLPMWTKENGSKSDPDYFIFSSARPDGYVPFEKTLSITVVLTEHPPIRHARDAADFRQALHSANAALKEAKESGWPNKGVFRDIRKK